MPAAHVKAAGVAKDGGTVEQAAGTAVDRPVRLRRRLQDFLRRHILVLIADDREAVGRAGAGLEGLDDRVRLAARCAAMPVLRSIGIRLMPSGTTNFDRAARPCSAACMNSLNIGAARPPPVAPRPSGPRLVEAEIEAGDQIGREADEPGVLLVVGGAGLAGDGRSSLILPAAVPRWTTPSIIEVIW